MNDDFGIKSTAQLFFLLGLTMLLFTTSETDD